MYRTLSEKHSRRYENYFSYYNNIIYTVFITPNTTGASKTVLLLRPGSGTEFNFRECR